MSRAENWMIILDGLKARYVKYPRRGDSEGRRGEEVQA